MNSSIGNLSKLLDITSSFPGILLDAYGVFWGGNLYGALPGARDAMETLVNQGKIVGILSNSTQLSEKEIEKLQKHNFQKGIHFHFYITSGDITRHILLHEKIPFKTPNNKFWLFDSEYPRYNQYQAIFQNTYYIETKNIEEADFIYINAPHIDGQDQTDPEIFRKSLEKIIDKKLPMVCANPDEFAHEGNPPKLVVRQGSIAKMYEAMGGTVLRIGKPSTLPYAFAMEVFSNYNINNPQDVLMIGDTPETDIRGACAFGMKNALITKTGVMAERVEHIGMETALHSLQKSDTPDYIIERLSI